MCKPILFLIKKISTVHGCFCVSWFVPPHTLGPVPALLFFQSSISPTGGSSAGQIQMRNSWLVPLAAAQIQPFTVSAAAPVSDAKSVVVKNSLRAFHFSTSAAFPPDLALVFSRPITLNSIVSEFVHVKALF